MPFNVSEIVNLGFAVFVAIYLLTKLDKTLNELNDTISSFREVINENKNANYRNIETTENQTELIRNHDAKLDDLINEMEKVPKRSEEGG
jgi:uncharacterized protein YoxC